MRLSELRTDPSDRLRERVALSGVQALLRTTLNRHERDAADGLRTAGLIAGYQGSPLGGVETAYDRDRATFEGRNIRFVSGVNEELGATMVWGSQLAALESSHQFDGVFGLWYGKAPGLDRAGDAIRHANYAGVDAKGGVVAAVGDDPSAKSSTLPSSSDRTLADLLIPTLYPADVQDVLDLGHWAYELSRFCGLWVGLKIVTDVADQYATVVADSDRMPPSHLPELPTRPMHSKSPGGATALLLEADIYGVRLDAAQRFVRANALDRTIGGDASARLGFVAAGHSYGVLRDALAELDLVSEDDLARAGIRVYKPAMIWPLESSGAAEFARGLEELVVIEDKTPFLETQLRDLLYHEPSRPRIVGKGGRDGDPIFPVHGSLVASTIVGPVRDRIVHTLGNSVLRRPAGRPVILSAAAVPNSVRLPQFCAGCPHSRSTRLPDGSSSGLGIGCHGMVMLLPKSEAGVVSHMGGEGAHWVGMSPFLSESHRFQNIGDGTFFHSGSLALRQAVAAGATITYKILYNGTVAMTGGQDAAGSLSVPELTRLLAAEGVVRTVVVTDEPAKYAHEASLAPNAGLEHRDELDAVQRELREVAGVTVIVYDQRCAAELRRDRKRGRVEAPTTRVIINEAVCDGCGDCGRVSGCASVHPVSTPFGRKTRIHQESCNFDMSCLSGNCPAFVTVEIDPQYRQAHRPTHALPAGVVPADPEIPAEGSVLIVGIGGTGVVTVNQILATAALLEGKHALSLDQTGLAQKGGQVVSNLRITEHRWEGAPRIGDAQADAMLIFDLLGGAGDDILRRGSRERTTAVVSTSIVPTAEMVLDVRAAPVAIDPLRQRIDSVTRHERNMWLDMEAIARNVFASQPAANLLGVGIAFQLGLLPLAAESIERAIATNGVAVELNVEAFRLGRRLVGEPELVEMLSNPMPTPDAEPVVDDLASKLIARVRHNRELEGLLRHRVPELIRYADGAHAERYVDVVARARDAELAVDPAVSALSTTVATQLFKLMSYKDEYEVARLHAAPELLEEIHQKFGPSARVAYHLRPPTAKRLLGTRKLAIPHRLARPAFRVLAGAKALRGRRVDPFGRSQERRAERALIVEYIDLVDRVLTILRLHNYPDAVAVLDLADQVRGFDEVKMANIERYRSDLAEALSAYERDQSEDHPTPALVEVDVSAPRRS